MLDACATLRLLPHLIAALRLLHRRIWIKGQGANGPLGSISTLESTTSVADVRSLY